jgi:DNA-binding response OmpR family regulator
MNASPANRVLVVENDLDQRTRIARFLAKNGYEFRLVASGEQALQAAIDFLPTIVLMSVSVPNQDGWLVCCKLKLGHAPPRIILITKTLADAAQRFADFVGAEAILASPLSDGDLFESITCHEFANRKSRLNQKWNRSSSIDACI